MLSRFVRTYGITVLLAVAAGEAIARTRSRSQFVTVGAAVACAAAALLSHKYRTREVVLWIALIVGALNFSGALFTPTNLSTSASLTDRLVKDIPLLLCLAVGALLPARAKASDLGLRVAILAAVLLIEILIITPAMAGTFVSLRYYVAYPLLAIAAARFDLSDQERYRVFRLIILLGLLESGIGIAEFFGTLGNTYYLGYSAFGSHVRAIGTLGNPDNLGLFLGLPILVSVAAWDSRQLFRRRMLALVILILLGGLAASFSKAAPIALATALLFQSKRTTGRSRTVLGVLLLSAFLAVAIAARHQGQPTPLLGSRVETSAAAYGEWARSPSVFMIGQGIGSETQLVGDSLQTTTTDNMILSMAVEAGLLGLIAFGWVILCAFRWARDATGLEMAFYGYAVFVLLYTPIYVNLRLYPAAFFFWLGVGLVRSRTTTMHRVQPEQLETAI
jgi:hypothetical protein